MNDDGARIRDRDHRISARSRARRLERTAAQGAVERNADAARRLIESEELLTPAELERAETQLKITHEHKILDDWHEAELAQYKARNAILNMRAWIWTVYIAIGCAWLMANLISGETIVISPVEIWRNLSGLG